MVKTIILAALWDMPHPSRVCCSQPLDIKYEEELANLVTCVILLRNLLADE
jgi:hypothetical protein